MKKSFANLKESSGLASLLYTDTTTARLSESTAIAQKPIKFTLYLEPNLAERVELLASLKGESKTRFLSTVLKSEWVLYESFVRKMKHYDKCKRSYKYEEEVEKMRKARQ